MFYFALGLFAVTYILMLVFSKYRPYIAIASGLIFVISGMLPLDKIYNPNNLNVILMIAGTMGIVALFTESKMPALLADLVMEKVPNVMWAAVSLALFAGVISAFVDNVATVLMVAPVALEICKKLKVNPVPFIVAIAVSSNLQGAATLVGDTTAIMLGSELDMSFLDFFWYQGKPSIFFAVEIGAIISALILAFIFRREKQKLPKFQNRTQVNDYIPTILLLSVLVLLIVASFIPNLPEFTNGLICCILLAIGLIYKFIKTKSFASLVPTLKEIDFTTIGILVGLFLMVGGIEQMGIIAKAAELLVKFGGSNPFIIYTAIVWVSVLLSVFIDNIPYTFAMLSVITQLVPSLGLEPQTAVFLYFGLLSGATLGGNCTPIGASANITGIGILRKEGYEVKNKDFFRIGIPFTLAAIIPAYIYIWVVYGI